MGGGFGIPYKKEFDEALLQAEIEQEKNMCYIEIFADKMDLPIMTKKIVENHLVSKKS